MWKQKSSTACAYRAILRAQTCVLNGPRQPARTQHVRVLSAAGYVETEVLNSMRLSCNSKSPNVCAEWSASTRAHPTPCAYRAILRAQTCVLNGPRQPARAQHVRVLSAAGYVETEVLNSMRLSCNSKSPNVRAEWSASTRACPTPCAYRAILRAQTCVLNGPRQPARAQHVRVLSSAGAQTCVLNGPRQPARAQHVRVLSAAGYVETDAPNSMRLSCNSKNPNVRGEWPASTPCAYRAILRTQTCVLNGPRQPARTQHVRVLSAAGYVETEVLNSMRLSCNSKSPNVCAEWSASTRARPTPCAYRAILRAQTCVLNGPRQPARAQHVRVLSSAGAQTCVLNGPRQPARAQHVRVLSAAGYVETDAPNSMRLSCNSKNPNVRGEWPASTPCAYRAILRTQTCVLNGPRQPARTQHVRVLSAAGYVETEVLNSMRLSCNSKSPNVCAEWSASTRARPTPCAYRAILRAQTCVLNGPRQPARAQHVRVLSSAGAQTCVLNGPRQPARAQHVRVLSAAGYVETDAPNSMCLSCNSKSPNVRVEWSASTRARPTPCAYRAILRAQTCVLNGPRQPARAQHVRVLSSAGAQTCVLNGPRQPARAQHVRVLSAAVETDAPTACAYRAIKNPNVQAQTCVLNGPRQPARAQRARFICGAAGYVETDAPTACAYRAILRAQTCVLNGPRQPARAQHVRVLSSAGAQTCVLNGPRQPARAQHVRVLSAAGYVETDAPNSMCLSCNSKSPNVRVEWSASTRARPTPCAYRAILRAQTCVLNGPRQPARAQHVRVLSAAGYVETEVLNSMRLSCNSKSPNVRVEWSASTRARPTPCAYRAILRAQTCVLNGPRQPARAQHVRVLSSAGYLETDAPNSMCLSCNSKSPNVLNGPRQPARAQPNTCAFYLRLEPKRAVLNGMVRVNPRVPNTCAFYLRLDMWKQTPPTACAYRAILRAQTCVLNGPRQPARAQHVRVLSAAGAQTCVLNGPRQPARAQHVRVCGWYVETDAPSMRLSYRAILRAQTCVLNGPRQPARAQHVRVLSSAGAQTCVLNGPRQPARAQHVRVLSSAGYLETDAPNSMRLSCNSKSPNVRVEWSASTRARPTRARFICGWLCGNRRPQQHALIVQF
uniref:Uncharacterized protein n=1 Tax=Globodera rostochiensis TaxID=31243 RepID=A0A914HK05_GLORO